MSDSIIIIPTYNEIENIERMIRQVFNYEKEFHLLIVDDNSPDGTASKVKELQKEYPTQLHLLQRPEKNGLGTAYKAGFDWCLKASYEYIFEMDADFSHNPADLKRLLKACQKGADMSVGSRYVSGGEVSNWDYKRIMISYFASLYVRIILWIGVKDSTAGFVCYHRRVLEAINLDKIEFIGYAFQIEMKYNAIKKGFKIVEVPIIFIDRQVGQSKMSMKIFTEAFFGVIKMRFRSIS